MNFSANWKLRWGSVPPNAVDVMRPAFALLLPGTPIWPSGLARLRRLNGVPQRAGAKGTRLKNAPPTRKYPGPGGALRGRLPNVPTAGRPKALPGLPLGVVL